MTLKEIIYAVSITFQVSGSILLLLYYFRRRTKDFAIHEYFPGSNIVLQIPEKRNRINERPLDCHYS